MLACSSGAVGGASVDVGAGDAATDASASTQADAVVDSGAGDASTATDSHATDSQTPVDAAAADTAVAFDGGPTPVDGGSPDAGCSDDEIGAPNCKDKLNTPEWATCCDARLKWCQTNYTGDQKAADTCQFGPNFSGTCTGCIPWGPPAPPAFDLAWRPQIQANGPVYEVS